MLLTLYRENRKLLQRNVKKFYKNLSKGLFDEGHTITPKQCAKKLDNLKTSYKDCKENQDPKKTGRNAKNYKVILRCYIFYI